MSPTSMPETSKHYTMEIEYSNEVRGKVFAYRFAKWEQKRIAEGLKPIVTKLEKKIVKIENDPKNEGQCTYSEQIRQLKLEINELNSIIKEFNSCS
jgi:hypothetical protein